jgi:MoaA/NifB/PqqE/SkfB family radical SAM enzyme
VQPSSAPETGPRLTRLSVELTNICNLHCGYCLRDEDALYHHQALFFAPDLLRRILASARDRFGLERVGFTGGEVTTHPRFDDIIETVVGEGLGFSFVTNGWLFERVFATLRRHRDAIRVIAFSLDGATALAHDRWRGEGSFNRVIQAVTRCRFSDMPFAVKVTLRRDTVAQLEAIVLLAARLGARSLHCSHLLPTSEAVEIEHALDLAERREAERELATLAGIVRMPVRMTTGYLNTDPAPPCDALAGQYCNVDYRGRMTLCCNLSGFRGAASEPDVVADLNHEDFADAYARLQTVREAQNERRRRALAAYAERQEPVDLQTGSPCLFCLKSFDKLPWHDMKGTARVLSIVNARSQEDGQSRRKCEMETRTW